eukprot:gene10531-biopygen7655
MSPGHVVSECLREAQPETPELLMRSICEFQEPEQAGEGEAGEESAGEEGRGRAEGGIEPLPPKRATDKSKLREESAGTG